MILEQVQSKIATRLTEEIGLRGDVGDFIFIFAALDGSRDVEYAIEELERSDDVIYKKAIGIVLEEVANGSS